MKKLVGGNWKECCSKDTFKFLGRLREEQFAGLDAFIAVPSIYIAQARHEFPAFLRIAAQDVGRHEAGTYTGEVSAAMLRENAVEYAIIGHSERRTHFGESSQMVAQKLKQCLQHGLRPVLCVGETADCRSAGTHIEFLHEQLRDSLGGCSDSSVDIAYEPLWAIGSVLGAGVAQIQEVAEHIHDWMASYGVSGRVLYGGAVTEKNVTSIIAIRSIDGVLVGNASLGEEFGAIAHKVRAAACGKSSN
ncbi:triosephosphate isomerase (TIM) [Pancytospora philotis]|nr:triosephosphate isomerase (TIM) [Pancytospora philotis]